jgi:hypothetical protein
MMLKRAIDVYNFLLDLFDSLKKPATNMKSLFLGASMMAVFGFAAFSVFTANGFSIADQSDKADDAQAATLANGSASAQQQADSAAGSSKSTVTPQTTANDAKNSADKQPAKTQESGSNKSFRTPITKDASFDIGALVGYDAAKGEKTYYAGGLTLSSSSLTVSKASKSAPIKVAASDSSLIAQPTKAVDDNQPNLAVELDAIQTSEAGDGYEIAVVAGDRIANGTYVVHVSAARSGGSPSDIWLYHGFITVNVVD